MTHSQVAELAAKIADSKERLSQVRILSLSQKLKLAWYRLNDLYLQHYA